MFCILAVFQGREYRFSFEERTGLELEPYTALELSIIISIRHGKAIIVVSITQQNIKTWGPFGASGRSRILFAA